MPRASCWPALLVLALAPLVTSDVILYSNKGSVGKYPGLYGGPLTRDSEGNLQVQEDIKAHCYTAPDGIKSSIKIKSIFVDDTSRSVYMWGSSDRPKTTNLFKGDTCLLTQTCTNSSITLVLDGVSDRKYQIGPFSAYQGQIYFVAMEEKPSPGDDKLKSYEVRKIDLQKNTCNVKNFPIEGSSVFSVETCSVKVGSLVSELAGEKMTPLDHLLVFDDNGATTFAVAMQSVVKRPKDQLLITLFVNQENSGKLAETVETIGVWPGFTSFVMKTVGGLAYRNGQLCWSALDRIRCMEFRDGSADRKRDVLSVGQSRSSCLEPGSDLPLANVTSGVAIVRADQEVLELTFGCIAMESADRSGGAGLITVEKGKETHVRPLLADDNTTKIYAESMAITTVCDPYTIDNSATAFSTFTVVFQSILFFLVACMYH